MHDANHANLRAYDRVAREYAGEEVGEDDPEMRRTVRGLFTERLRGTRVLEVGCGPGTDTHFFSEAGLDVVATDFSAEFIAVVRERYPEITSRVMDMTAPDLPAASFDGIYGFASFLHLPRTVAVPTLAGLRALLAPGGLLFLSLIASSMHREYTIENWCGEPDNAVLFTCYVHDEIAELFRGAGLGEIEIFEISSPVYEQMPRLAERGVTSFQIAGRTS